MDIQQEKHSTTLASYLIGLFLCIGLTLLSYFTVQFALFSTSIRSIAIIILGLLQAWIQIVLFLHLRKEPNPKWHTMTFFSMLFVLVILVLGSLWIMQNLNYRTMPSIHSSS